MKKEIKEMLDKKGKLLCGCGKKIKPEQIKFYYKLDMNHFDWWYYQYLGYDKKTLKFIKKISPRIWYGYIGYIPILRNIVYFIWEKVHTPDYYTIIECDSCFEDWD